MTQTALFLVVSLAALLVGACITWLAMRNSASLSADKARAEVGTELALALQNLQGQDTIRKGIEARLAESHAEATRLRELHEQVSGERGRLQERASRVEVLEQNIIEADREADTLREQIGSLRDQLGRAEGAVQAEREAHQLLAANFTSEQAARIAAENNAVGLVAKLEGFQQHFVVKEQQFAEKLAFVEDAKQKLTEQFKNLANDILEDKSKRFAEQNKNSLGNLLNPLKEQLVDFKAKVETVYDQEGKERVALQEQVRQLMGLNQTLSKDAQNLTSALKGSSKVQGNWGELVLENILESSGLRRGHEFDAQASHTNEEGRRLQPDIIIRMPEERSLVVDSKMSLNAYAEYVNAGEGDDTDSALKRHVQSIRSHIKGLASKNYQNLYQLKTLDFVVMFIPVEPAYLVAVGQDATLYQDAWKDGVLLVSPSTLMFVLRTVEHLWRQEQQNRNAKEIAQRGGELYNKLCLFVDDLNKVESSLAAAQNAFGEAKHRLVHQRGSVIRQAEMLMDLGVKPSKKLPAGYSTRQEIGEGDATDEDTKDLVGPVAIAEEDRDVPDGEGVPVAARARRPRADSALARCREIYIAHIDTHEPRDIKRMMIEQACISESVANTYFSNIKREIDQAV